MKKLKMPLSGIVASAMLMMPVSNVLAAQTTGVYDGCTYTVSATSGTFSGSGYGRYADSSKGLSLTVTFKARNANGVWQTKTASKGGTTYVSATTERLFNIDTATKSTTASLWIAGATFSARE